MGNENAVADAVETPSATTPTSTSESDFAALERFIAGEDDPTPTPKQEAKPSEPKELVQKDGSDDDEPSDDDINADLKRITEERAAKKAAAEKPTDKATGGPKALRDELDKLRSDLKAREMELETFRKAPKPPELTELSKQLEAERKRAEDNERAAAAADYRQSAAFKEKYVAPLDRAFAQFTEEIKDLKDVDGKPVQEDDVLPLLRMNTNDAGKAAIERFGPNAITIMTLRNAVVNANKARLDGERKAGEEALNVSRAARATFAETKDQIARKFASVYDPGDDSEGKAAFEKYQKLAEQVLWEPNSMDPSHRATVAANVVMRAAALGPWLIKAGKLESERDQLKAKLAAYENSAPSKDSPKPEKSFREMTVEEEIDAMAAGRR